MRNRIVMSDAAKRVQIARTTLLLDNPFFGVLALGLHYVEDPTCRTAWTDGTTLGFNPTFVMSLSDDQLLGLLAHEVMHCACGHPWRRGTREHRKFNVAADHAINHVLTGSNFALPAGALMDPQFKGHCAEWVYDRLPEDSQQQQPAAGSPETWGEVRDAPSDSEVTEGDWQQQQQTAIAQAKQRGKLPGHLQQAIASAHAPTSDWRSLLRRFVTERASADYAWQYPSRRYLARGIYMPELRSEKLGAIVVFIDTSGSIDVVLLAQFTGQLQAIVDDLQPTVTIVVQCDARVQSVERFEAGDRIRIVAKGRGGTDFRPAFDWLLTECDDAIACCIYFTDLYGTFPEEDPGVPTLWAAYGNADPHAPFGEIVPCE